MDGRPDCAPSQWDNHVKIFHLTEKMRSITDPEFGEVCDRIAVGKITEEDEVYMKNLVRKSPNENNNDLFKTGQMSIIVTTNKKRERINLEKLEKLLPDSPEYICNSRDQSTNVSNPPELNENLNYTDTGNLQKSLRLRVGAPIMVTVNHPKAKYKQDGVCNGARGYIDSFQLDKEDKNQVRYIWVVFKDEEIGQQLRRDNMHLLSFHKPNNKKAVPIEVCRIRFNVRDGNVSYHRTQFAAVLAYSVTVHRSQGETLVEVILDFSSEGKQRPYIIEGSFYVAITRATSAKHVFLEDFDKSYIKASQKVLDKIEAMRKFQKYIFKKIYLSDQIFLNSDQELKVGYLNIRNLTAKLHAEYVNADKNLFNLDILVIAETWLTDHDNDEDVAKKLDNFIMLARFDAGDSSKHCGILVLSSRKSKFDFKGIKINRFQEFKGKKTHMQGLIMFLSDLKLKLAFLYIRETPTTVDIQNILEHCRDCSALIGDLNLNPRDSTQLNHLKLLCKEDKYLALKELTTRYNNQLEHIVVNTTLKPFVYATSYFNLISDHKTVTIRFGIENNQFTEAFLKKISCSEAVNIPVAETSSNFSYPNTSAGGSSNFSYSSSEDDTATCSNKKKRKPAQPKISDSPKKKQKKKGQTKHPQKDATPTKKRSKHDHIRSKRPCSNSKHSDSDSENLEEFPVGIIQHRRMHNSDMSSCWLNCCLQALLTAIDNYLARNGPHKFQSWYSTLGVLLLHLQMTDLTVSLDTSSVRDLLVTADEERIDNERKRIINEIVNPREKKRQLDSVDRTNLHLGIGQQCARDFFVAIRECREAFTDVYEFLNYPFQAFTTCLQCNESTEPNEREELYREINCPPHGSNLKDAVLQSFREGTFVEDRECHSCGTTGRSVTKNPISDVNRADFLTIILRRTEGYQNPRILHHDVTAVENVILEDMQGNEATYQPICVIRHEGEMNQRGDTAGHYTADVKNHRLQKWFHTSDNFIPTPISPDQVTKRGYIILHSRYLFIVRDLV